MKIALSTDHAGFNKLKLLKSFLESGGHECIDYGPKELDSSDDYPDFIFPAAEAVAKGECNIGIIWGGSGQGEAMVANRVKGVRCTVYYGPAKAVEAVNAEGKMAEDDLEILRLARDHNLANMLSLGARFLTFDQVKDAVDVWLHTPAGTAERHNRRIKKMDK